MFTGPPKPPTPEDPPGVFVYVRALQWWASRYAWDRADGLPSLEAASGLLRVAVVGPAKKKDNVGC